MSGPLYSIIIPTRERHPTLRSAIESVLAQTVTDYELIVMDNAGTPETAAVVKSFDSPRLKYHRSEERLAMSDNWELGLSHAKGTYVFVLGDDDAMFPDGIERVHRLIKAKEPPAVCWGKHQYWWHDALVPEHRNRLYLRYAKQPRVVGVRARSILEAYYAFEVGYEELPGLYNGFIHRRVLDEVTRRGGQGKYFHHRIPDVYSALVNTFVVDHYVRFPHGASLSGNSGFSTGCSMVFPNAGSASFGRFADENKGRYDPMHPRLVESSVLEVQLADTALWVRDRFFPDEPKLDHEIPKLVEHMVAALPQNGALYDKRIAALKRLCEKHGLAMPTSLPPKPEGAGRAFQGLSFDASGGAMIAVNCEQAGVHDAAAAARLAMALMPAAE